MSWREETHDVDNMSWRCVGWVDLCDRHQVFLGELGLRVETRLDALFVRGLSLRVDKTGYPVHSRFGPESRQGLMPCSFEVLA